MSGDMTERCGWCGKYGAGHECPEEDEMRNGAARREIADLRAKLAAAERERNQGRDRIESLGNLVGIEGRRAEAAEAAEAKRLRAALEPFAAFAGILPDIGCGSWADAERIIEARGHPARLTVGHCRAARAALARSGGGGG